MKPFVNGQSGFDCSPRDDLYRHVNGEWLKTAQIPGDRSTYSCFTVLADEALARVRGILEECVGGAKILRGRY